MNTTTFFQDLTDEVNAAFIYTPRTGEQIQMSQVDDIIEWANVISGEWNGDESGSEEDRAHQADEITQKCNELKELILGMSEL